MSMSSIDLLKTASARVDEEYILDAFNRTATDTYSDHKERITRLKQLYRGDWLERFGSDASIVGATRGGRTDPWIENSVKNGIHDLARLAADARPTINFMAKGEGDREMTAREIREVIAATIWMVNEGDDSLQRKLYLDMISTGMAAASVIFNKGSEYAQIERLNPENCYPDVRNSRLRDMLYIEKVKLREADRLYPTLGLRDAAPWSDKTCALIDYYNTMEVVQAVVLTQGGRTTTRQDGVHIVKRWEHNLEEVPVAFVQLDSLDDALRGWYDQAGGSLLARNKIVSFMLDYMESMVHAPFESKNIINADDEPGPTTIYQHDPNAQESFHRRVQPASPAGAVFGITQYLETQTMQETIQPPARAQGTVPQNIASGSFVASTQGRLTSAVKELQDMNAVFRKKLNRLCFKVEEKWLDFEKPLYRAVGKSKITYLPSKDIGEWYHHNVEFGAAAGIGREGADTRVLMHLGARLISKGTARSQIDYIPDEAAEQNKINLEMVRESIIQRFAADPRTPFESLLRIEDIMAEGDDMATAFKEVRDEVARTMQQQRVAEQGVPAEIPQPEEGRTAEEEALALEKGEIPSEAELQFAPPPLQQQILRNLG